MLRLEIAKTSALSNYDSIRDSMTRAKAKTDEKITNHNKWNTRQKAHFLKTVGRSKLTTTAKNNFKIETNLSQDLAVIQILMLGSKFGEAIL